MESFRLSGMFVPQSATSGFFYPHQGSEMGTPLPFQCRPSYKGEARSILEANGIWTKTETGGAVGEGGNLCWIAEGLLKNEKVDGNYVTSLVINSLTPSAPETRVNHVAIAGMMFKPIEQKGENLAKGAVSVRAGREINHQYFFKLWGTKNTRTIEISEHASVQNPMTISLEGRLSTSEYEGKTYVSIEVNMFPVLGRPLTSTDFERK